MSPRTRQLCSISLLIDIIIYIFIPICCLCFYSITAVLSEITIMLFYSLCNTQFSSRYALGYHQNTKHNETISGYSCIHCNKIVTTKYSLKKKDILICNSSVPSIPKCKQVGGMKKQAHQDNEEPCNAPSTGINPHKCCLKQNWSAIKTYSILHVATCKTFSIFGW